MRKGLITTLAVSALLAVSCSNGSSPAKEKGFKLTEAVEFYAERGVSNVTIPNYVAEDKEATITFDESLIESNGWLKADIKGSTKEEMDAFADSLEDKGWTVGEGRYSGDYEAVFGDSLAHMYVENWLQETAESIRLYFFVEEPLPTAWPAQTISDIFDYYEADYFEVPAFVAADATFDAQVYSESGFYADGVYVKIDGATEAEVNTYLQTTLPGADWTVSGSSLSEGYLALKTFDALEGVANVSVLSYQGSIYVIMLFDLTPIPGSQFPHDAINAAFASLGLDAFPLVEPDGTGYTYEYEFDKSNIGLVDYPNYCYDTMWINNMSEEQFGAYRTKLETNGWTTTSTQIPYDYEKVFEDLGLRGKIQLSWSHSETYGDYAGLRIFYVAEQLPSKVWPAAKIAELLGEEVTDVLPALTGYEDATFLVYKDAYGMGVSCFVGQDNVSAAMSAYEGILTTNNFVPADKEHTFVSENRHFSVELWEGTDGAFNIELTVIPQPGFIGRAIQKWLKDEKEIDFALLDFSSVEEDVYIYDAEESDYYVYFYGDVVDDILAILDATELFDIPATPGYYGYECISKDEKVEIDVMYDEDYDMSAMYVYSYQEVLSWYA